MRRPNMATAYPWRNFAPCRWCPTVSRRPEPAALLLRMSVSCGHHGMAMPGNMASIAAARRRFRRYAPGVTRADDAGGVGNGRIVGHIAMILSYACARQCATDTQIKGPGVTNWFKISHISAGFITVLKIGRASCRERVCQYV